MSMRAAGDPGATLVPDEAVHDAYRPAVLGGPVEHAFTRLAEEILALVFRKWVDRDDEYDQRAKIEGSFV